MSTRSPLVPPHNASRMEGDSSMIAKRVRKVVNCEPCRVNKLKCNRGRPCSSCELRGTTSQCYQDASPQDFATGHLVNPLSELEKIRKSMTLLENHFRFSQNSSSTGMAGGSPADVLPMRAVSLALSEARTFIGSVADEFPDKSSPGPSSTGPGAHGRSAGGYYAGPTSTSAHLIAHDVEELEASAPYVNPSGSVNDDSDVMQLLPAENIITGFVDYYFTYCQWIYRHISQSSFRPRWVEYMAGHRIDRLVLATCCGVLALTSILMPDGHELAHLMRRSLGPQPNVKLFDMMETVLGRYEASIGNASYSLELAELLFMRAHYLLYANQNGEEVWAAKSRMMSVATAMGLHRDPSQWRMPVEIAERRRWIWWTMLCLERWLVFLLGRPPSIAGHHFDTQLPKQNLDPSHDLLSFASSIHFFRLTDIGSQVTDDALSLMPVPASKLQKHENSLLQWSAQIPPEWNMNDRQIEQSLCSSDLAVRRVTVQALFVLTTYHLLRFTLHRAYAARTSIQTQFDSVDIAAISAEQLIHLARHCRIEAGSPPETVFATRGLLAFHTFQLFSAAMFFSFHLIGAPTGPRETQCRRNINLARSALEATPLTAPSGPLAAKAAKILTALSPLWEEKFVRMRPGAEKEAFKSQLLVQVRSLAFPFHEPQSSRSSAPPMGTHAPDLFISKNHVEPEMWQLRPETFGNSGTLMPDMSVSRQLPINTPDVGVGHTLMNILARNSTAINDMKSSSSFYTGPSHQPFSSSATIQPQTSNFSIDHGMMPFSPALPQRSYLSPSSHTYFPSQMQVNANGTPAYDSQLGHNGNTYGIGGVSQEMTWGASMGIDSGEWAEFVQTMVPQPFSFQQEQRYDIHQRFTPTG